MNRTSIKNPSAFQASIFMFLLCLFLLFVLFAMNSFAQVNVGATPYTTLKGAFDAINAGTHTGAITITITGNTTETASAVLNASGSGSANYTSISISPIGGASRTISGSLTGYIIDLNGADNVTINGLNTGGNSLTISNSATTASGALRFINDATNNIITNVTLSGSTTSTIDGVVFFSTGATTGNNNNTISNSTLKGTGSNLPSNCIQAAGTSASIGNANITITGCNIQDFFNASTASYGMTLGIGSDAWIITNNKFFQTGTRTYTSANTHSAIIIFNGAGYTVTGNTIGFAAADGSGTYTMAGTIATRFVGINMNAGTTSAVNSVQGNTVAGISLATSSGAATNNGVLCGIYLGAGNFNIGNITPNTIGATTGVNSLAATPTTTQGAVVGICCVTTGTVLIQNNTFGAMSSSGSTAAVAGGLFGVYVGANVPASLTITGNTFGNATADNMRGGTNGLTTGNSIVAGINYALTTGSPVVNITNNTFQNFSSYGTGTTGYVRGIFTGSLAGGPTINISNNTITNLNSNAATTTSIGVTGVQGIGLNTGSACVISGNTIYNLNNTNTGTGGYSVSGIGIANTTNPKISNNIIYGLSNASTSTTVTQPGFVSGILVRSATTSDTIANNMIALGAGQTTNTVFVGIQLSNASTPDPVSNIFYNTVYISGTVTSGAQPSFCIARTDFTVTAKTAGVFIRNNICDNARTGGTGQHFAIANNYGPAASSSTGWTASACDYNVFNSADTSTIGWWSGALGLAGWKAASAGDTNSWSGVPITYTNTSTGNLRFNMGVTPTKLESRAIPITSVTTDIDGFARPKPGAVNGGALAPDMGAGESDMVPILPLPVELASFTSSINGNNVALNWSTVMEQNNKGFDIERKLSGTIWKTIGYVEGHGTTNQINNYSFTERGMASGHYNYRLKQIDYNGNYKYYDLSNEVIIGIPSKYSLAQNYPNPFNPVSVIGYQIPASVFVSLKIFDISGREVASLVNEAKDAGYYSVTFDAKNLSSGTYFYKLSTDNFSAVKKMVLVK